MELIVERDYEHVSKRASTIVLHELTRPGRINFMITAGKTPNRLYEILADAINDTSWRMTISIITCRMKAFPQKTILNNQKHCFYSKLAKTPGTVHPLSFDTY